eukprot:gene7484-biopygen9086
MLPHAVFVQGTRTGRGPYDRIQRNGRGPDAGRTIEFKGTDADRTRAWPFLPTAGGRPSDACAVDPSRRPSWQRPVAGGCIRMARMACHVRTGKLQFARRTYAKYGNPDHPIS